MKTLKFPVKICFLCIPLKSYIPPRSSLVLENTAMVNKYSYRKREDFMFIASSRMIHIKLFAVNFRILSFLYFSWYITWLEACYCLVLRVQCYVDS